jgi:hypothetical protein
VNDDRPVWVRRPGSGIVEPRELPRLTLADAIERGWQRREDGRLLMPHPPVYLPTYPLPPLPPSPPSWLSFVLAAPWGPL